MARVLLVNYVGFPYCPSSLMPDNGLAALAGSLKSHGHDVLILDYATVSMIRRLYPRWISRRVAPVARRLFMEGVSPSWRQAARMAVLAHFLDRRQRTVLREISRELAATVRSYQPDLVGFKLWNGDGFSGSVSLASHLRRNFPNLPLVAGGPQVDYFGEHILDYTSSFDALVYGDGEETFPLLLDTLLSRAPLDAVPNLIFRRDGLSVRTARLPVHDLDSLAPPDYSARTYPALASDEKIKITVIDESRGCPCACAFCIHPVKSGGVWRERSPQRIVDQMQSAVSSLGSRLFVYAGSNTSAKVAMGIAEEILRRSLDVRYACFGHARGLSGAEFDLLKRSGCRAVFYGLESASQQILDRSFNKRITVSDAERVLAASKASGIFTIASIIHPAPFETPETAAQTLDFLLRLRPDSVPVTAPGVIPGTPWHTDPARFGFTLDDSPDVWRYALTYKIKLLYPPSFWKRLPYTLNGKDSRTLFAESGSFASQLEESGILTNVPHEMVVMSDALGMSPRRFRDLCRTVFFSGDADAVSDLVSSINRAAAALTQTIPYPAPAPAPVSS